MSIKRLSGAGLTTPKTNKLWDQTTFQSGMFALATVTLTSSTTASVTFSGIPANYTHLQIRAIARSASTGGSMRLDFNGDASGTLYSRHLLMGDGASVSASGANADTVTAAVGDFPVTSVTSNVFSGYVIDILDAFSTTKNKVIRSLSGYDANGSGVIQSRSTMWRSQNAITSIKLYEGSGSNFAANTTFALYGIRSA